ncbi:MAG TPA: glycoside hydrolase family 127 protein [Bryobacteraceae bacterium]|nr:glycoside hydrolase family 127 protein [Bryobacteraceae bacterium]
MEISRRSLLAGATAASYLRAAPPARDYPVQPVPFTAVHMNDTFWAPRIETNRAVTIPFAFAKCEETGRVDNFVRAAAVLRGENPDRTIPPYPFDDTDIYKVIEGASYSLSVQKDPKLEAYLDTLIEKIAAAQEPDGYLYTARTIDPEHPHKWAGKERWVQEEVLSHELYNLGHLYEAAVAHYQATGKRTLLDISLKTAELLCRTFGPGKRKIYSGHQIVEMGLVKLYRVTNDERYLNLAKFMLDARAGGNAYNQAHERVVDQREAVGHAVRATYMYAGIADVAAITGDKEYVAAIDAIWENVVSKKLYLTGGIGALHKGEAFGDNFELPNATAYNETCAAIGHDYWNHRLFLLHADAKYIDVMERTLYNGLISGVSLDGKLFFYPNPLSSAGDYERSPWFGVACCPGNITRFIASVPGYMYAHQGDTLYVNLFAASSAHIDMAQGRAVKMTQETRYPWDGAVRVTVDPAKTSVFAINVRVPGWAREEVLPSALYRFAEKSSHAAELKVTLKVNGRPVPVRLDKGYVSLRRKWRSGDTIELDLPMQPRRVLASADVEADRALVAIQRGPIVYCAEWPDNASNEVAALALPDDSALTTEFRPDLLNGVMVVKGRGLTAIPYYAWAHRGKGQMAVWLRKQPATNS